MSECKYCHEKYKKGYRAEFTKGLRHYSSIMQNAFFAYADNVGKLHCDNEQKFMENWKLRQEIGKLEKKLKELNSNKQENDE